MERQPPAIGTIFVAPDPPPFPSPPRNVDFTPLEFILSLLALVTIPALIYTFFMSLKCPPSNPFTWNPRGAATTREEGVRAPTARDDKDATPAAAAGSGRVKYSKEAHVGEIGSECPVCLSVFNDGEEVKVLGPCKHSFHAVCVDLWLSSHSSCPVCRVSVNSGKPPAAGDDRRRSAGAGGGRRRDDLQQGLPDASNLV